MKKFVLLVLLLLLAAAGVGVYFYGKITYRPEWYSPGQKTRGTILAIPDASRPRMKEES